MRYRFSNLVAGLLMLFAGIGTCDARTGNFPIRAFHLDFRTEVMTLDAMKRFVDRISERGINTLVMEWEATFPFDKHATLSNASAFTREEVISFIDYCGGRGIEVIPLQNCFGHCEYILQHERYRALREDVKDPSQVCPLKIEEATACFSELFAEVAALHPSKYFHIGADETYLLGLCGNCRAAADREGKSRLFVDYVKAMCEIVHRLGKTPVIWADIILKYPEALDELPDDLIFVDWNYGWEPDRFGKLDNLLSRGVKLWGAPALRSGPDNLYLTQWKKHFDNLAVFVGYAREHDYGGMIETSWSTSGTYGYWFDNGHEILSMQPVRLVYPMSAFRILEAACCEAFVTDAPFEPEAFVRRYARTELGLDDAGAGVLWRYFSMPQETVTVSDSEAKDASGRDLHEVIDECVRMRDELARLKPRKGAEEAAHYLLMLDIRINYLRFKAVEARYQSASFDRSGIPELVSGLKTLLAETRTLDRRFARLNGGYLKAREIEYMNTMRSVKMKSLYERLTNNTR